MSPWARWATCWRCWSRPPTNRNAPRLTSVKLAYVDQGYAGEKLAAQAEAHGIGLEAVKLAEAKRGFVLLLRRWVVERSCAWLARFRRLSRDYERASCHPRRPALASLY